MNKEGELTNFQDEPEYDFKFDWVIGKTYEHWIDVESGKLRIRTEVAYFKLPDKEGQEIQPNEHNQK